MVKEFFKNEKMAIEQKVNEYFESLLSSQKDPLFYDFLTQLKEFILNLEAKRIHPVLLIAAFMGIVNPLYVQDQIDEIRKVAISVELLHNAHLIHDDLIDEDILRRNKPTFHVQLKEELKKIIDAKQISKNNEILAISYGEKMSVLGGSFAYLLGLDIIKASKFSEKLKLMAIKEYSEAMDYIIKGQIIEEYMYYHDITMSLEQYLSIAELLRARLFEKSSKIGAILAKGNLHYQIKPLSNAMLKIGQAHAIIDDILDLHEDIQNKKKKVIYILALQNTNEEESRILKEIYNKERVSQNDIKRVEKIFASTNAPVIAEHLAKNLIEQAKQDLKDIYPDLNKKQKIFFNEFSDFLFLRKI